MTSTVARKRDYIILAAVAIMAVCLLVGARAIQSQRTTIHDQGRTIDNLEAQVDRIEEGVDQTIANQESGRASRLEFQNNITETLCARIRQNSGAAVAPITPRVNELCSVHYE